MYSRYRRRLSDSKSSKRNQSLIPRLSSNQLPAVLVLVLLLVAIPLTKFALEHNTYQRNKAFEGKTDKAKGMVFDGLELSSDCPGGFKLHASDMAQGKAHCTHGPDPAPEGFMVAAAQPPVPTPAPISAYPCDGDGTSGKRIQVIYAHPPDPIDDPGRYAATAAAYLTSFQTWAAGVDAIYNESAAETGGSRHVRFVQNSQNDCKPKVANVTLSETGDDTFGNTFNELWYQGYNRDDRKYLVFVDASVYCGIATMEIDDTLGSSNRNNLAPHYSRIDSGCWSDVIPAHESMHNLGGVQNSAPHATGGNHCTDPFDRMCYSDSPYYPPMITPYLCPDNSHSRLFDCNHDDYYSTNPAANNYLTTHWNAANSLFLVGAVTGGPVPTNTPTPKPTSTPVPTPVPQPMTAAFILTGAQKGKTFTPTTTFSKGAKVIAQVHVIGSSGLAVSGVTVSMTIRKPDNTSLCSLSGSTNSSGDTTVSCTIPRTGPAGQWRVHVENMTKSGYFIGTNSATDTYFTVQ